MKFLFSPILFTLSKVYKFIIDIRNFLYEKNIFSSYTSKLPTICVGNFTVGGNSKTPLAIFVAEHYKRLGKKPVILMRGYKGSLEGPVQVSKYHNFKDVGDEAILLSKIKNISVVVSKKRVLGAKYIEKNNIGDIIILDDGLQHRALNRNINITSLYEKHISELKKPKLLPYGICRESAKSALKRTNLLIITSRNSKKPKEVLPEILNYKNTFYANYKLGKVTCLKENKELNSKNVIAISAIANPEGFYTSVEELGLSIIEKIELRDHSDFDINKISSVKANHPNTPLICTEKDSVKLIDFNLNSLYVLPIEIEISNKEKFFELITNGY